MDKFEVFNDFLKTIGETSPEHKDLLESVRTGVKLILEAEGDGFANIISKIPEFLKNTKTDGVDPEVLATRFVNKIADKSIDAMTEPEFTELMEIIEETIAETLNVSAMTEAEEGEVEATPIHKIRSAYDKRDEESVEHGDAFERGWLDEEGESMEPDEWDLEDGLTAVDLAVKYLKDKGPLETDQGGTTYSTSDSMYNRDRIENGIEEYRYYFLDGFTDEEIEQIRSKIK